MDPELLEMLEEHIHSFRDEAYVTTLREACSRLVNSDDSEDYSFLIGSLYGSCLFIRDSYSSKPRSKEDENAFNEWFYSHVNGLDLS